MFSCVAEMSSSSGIHAVKNEISSDLQSFPLWKGSLLVNGDLVCNAHLTANEDLEAIVAFLDTSLNVEKFISTHEFGESILSSLIKSRKKQDGSHSDQHYNTFNLIPSDNKQPGKFCQFIAYLVQERAVGVVPLRMASCLYLMVENQLPLLLEVVPNEYKHSMHHLSVLIVTPKTLSSKVKERKASNLVKICKRKDSEMAASISPELQMKLHSMKIETFAAVGSMQPEQINKLFIALKDKDEIHIGDELLPTHYKDGDTFFQTVQSRKHFLKKLEKIWTHTCRARMSYYRPEEAAPSNGYGKKSILKRKSHFQSSSSAGDGPLKASKRIDQGAALYERNDGSAASYFMCKKVTNQSSSTTSKRKFPSEPDNANDAVPIKISRPSFNALGDAILSGNVTELMQHPDFMVSDRFKETHRVSSADSRTDQLDFEKNKPISVTFRQQAPFSTDQDCPYAYEDQLIKSTLRSMHGVWINDLNSCKEDREKVDWVRRTLHHSRTRDNRFPMVTGEQEEQLFDVRALEGQQSTSAVEPSVNYSSSAQTTVQGSKQSPPSTNSTSAATHSSKRNSDQQEVNSRNHATFHGHPQDPRLNRRSRLRPSSYRLPLLEETPAVFLKNSKGRVDAAEKDKMNMTLKKTFPQEESLPDVMTRQRHSALVANKSSFEKISEVGTDGLHQTREPNTISHPRFPRAFPKRADDEISADKLLKKTMHVTLNERFQGSKERALIPKMIRRQAITRVPLSPSHDKTADDLEHGSALLTAEELSAVPASPGSVQPSKVLSSRIPILCTGKRISFNKSSDKKLAEIVLLEQPTLDIADTNASDSNFISAAAPPRSHNANIGLSVTACNFTNTFSPGGSRKAHSCEALRVSPTLPHLAHDRCSHEQHSSPQRSATSRSSSTTEASSSTAEAPSLHLDDSYIQRIREKRIRVKQSKCGQLSNRAPGTCFLPSDISLQRLHPSSSDETSTSKPVEDQNPTRFSSVKTLTSNAKPSCDNKRIAGDGETSLVFSNLTTSRERSPKLVQPTMSVSESEKNSATLLPSNCECSGLSSKSLYSEIDTLVNKAREIKQNPAFAGALSDRLLQLALHLRQPIATSLSRPKQDAENSESGVSSSESASMRPRIGAITSGVAFPITNESDSGTTSAVMPQRGGEPTVHGSLVPPILATGFGNKVRTSTDYNVQTAMPTSTSSYIDHPTVGASRSVLPADSHIDFRVYLNSNEKISKSSPNEIRPNMFVSDRGTPTQNDVEHPKQFNSATLETDDTNYSPHTCQKGLDMPIDNSMSLLPHEKKILEGKSSLQSCSCDRSLSFKDSATDNIGDNHHSAKLQKIAHVKPQPVSQPSPSFYVFNPRDHPTCDEIESLLLITKGIRFEMKQVANVIANCQSDSGDSEDSFLQITQDILDKLLNVQSLWIVIRSADMDLISKVPYMTVLKCAGHKVQFVRADNAEEVNTGQYTNILNGEYGILIPVSVDVLLQSNSVFLQLIKWMGRLHQKTKQLVWRIALYQHIGKQLRCMSTQSDVGEIRRKRALRLVDVMEEHPAMIINLVHKDNSESLSSVLDSALTLQLQNVTTTRHIVILTGKEGQSSGKWDAHMRAGFAVATVHQFVRTVMEDNSEMAKKEKSNPYSPLLKLYHVNK